MGSLLDFFYVLVYFCLSKEYSKWRSVEFPTEAKFADNSQKEIMTGTIKRLTDKGFGFIAQEGEEKDLFFHSSSLIDLTFEELNEGDAVEFEVEQSDKGPRAVDVKRA